MRNMLKMNEKLKRFIVAVCVTLCGAFPVFASYQGGNESVSVSVSVQDPIMSTVYTVERPDPDVSMSGVEIENPYAGSGTLAAETISEALANSKTPFNAYVYYRKGTADEEAQLYVAPFSTVAEAKAYDEAVKEASPSAGIVTTLSAADAVVGNVDFTKPADAKYGQAKIMNLACVRGGDEAADTELSFPLPEWKTGASISMWVRASSSTAAPIFTFSKKMDGKTNGTWTAGLTLFTDGSATFAESVKGTGQKNNRYCAKFTNEYTPVDHVGEWVYVTISMQNDGFDVYYNGEATDMREVLSNSSGNVKYFNYSYGFRNGIDRLGERVRAGAYDQRLIGFSLDDFADPDYDLLTNYETMYVDWYPYRDSNGYNTSSIMQYLADPETRLYIGGAPEGSTNKWLETGTAGENYVYKNGWTCGSLDCREASIGMMVGDPVFEEKAITKQKAYLKYIYATDPDHVMMPSDDLKQPKSFTKQYTVTGPATDDLLSGIELENPYAGSETLAAETISEALANSKTPFNAYVYYRKGTADEEAQLYVAPFSTVAEAKAYDEAVKEASPEAGIVTTLSAADAFIGNVDFKYPEKSTGQVKIMNLACVRGGAEAEDTELSFPLPEWKTGASISMWVKASSATAAPIFTFSKKMDEKTGRSSHTAGLTLFTDGSATFNDNTSYQNRYCVKFTNEYTPADHVGEWVYVTISMQNDGFEIYYNGEAADMREVLSNSSSGAKYFNYGYGFKNDINRLEKRISAKAYAQRLLSFCMEDFGDSDLLTDYETMYSYWEPHYDSKKGSKMCSIMQYLADPETRLYIGGAPEGSTSEWTYTGTAGETYVEKTGWTFGSLDCREASIGMMVGDPVFEENVTTKKNAYLKYMDALDSSQTPATGPAVTKSPEPVATKEPGKSAAPTWTPTPGPSIEVPSSESPKEPVSKTKQYIVTKPAQDASMAGIELENPYAGSETLASETIAEALANSKTPFNAYVYYRKESADKQAQLFVAPFSTVAEAKAYDEAVKEASPEAGIVTTLSAADAFIGNADFTKPENAQYGQVKIMNLACVRGGAEAEDTELSFPLPEWKTGASISMWVKASSSTAAPIFTFSKKIDENTGVKSKTGGLTLFTDGSAIFAEAGSNVRGKKYNQYCAKFTNEYTPADHAGEWIYVTISIQNDGFDVYYNGKATDMSEVLSNSSGNVKYFNYGYGFRNGKDRLEKRVSVEAYRIRLSWFALEDFKDADLLTNYETMYSEWVPHYDSNGWNTGSIMQYLADPETRFYIGGAPEGSTYKWLNTGTAGESYTNKDGSTYGSLDCREASIGMEITGAVFEENITTEKEAWQKYLDTFPLASAAPQISSEPEASLGPSVSYQPLESFEPLVSYEPLESFEPLVSYGPSASFEPSVSSGPKASYEPSESSGPKASYKPSVSSGPKTSYKPSVSSEPKASYQPSESSGPKASYKPSESSEPKASFEPLPSLEPRVSIKPVMSSEPLESSEPLASVKPQESLQPGESKEPGTAVMPQPTHETKTEIINGSDGSVTEKKTDIVIEEDGSKKETVSETIKNPDGSLSEKETQKLTNPDGTKSESVTEKVTDKNGTVTETKTETITKPDGSTDTIKSETITEKDGALKEVIESLKEENGKILSLLEKILKYTEELYNRYVKKEEKQENGGTVLKEISESAVEVNGEIKKQATVTDEKKDKDGKSLEKYEYDRNVLGENVEWTTKCQQTLEDAFKEKVNAKKPLNTTSYDITPTVDGEQVQVSGGSVKVTLFYGEQKKKNSRFKVYDCEQDKWLDSYFKNGYVMFDAPHFSKYIVTEIEGGSRGDVDGDGKVTLLDAQRVLKAALKITSLQDEQKQMADVNEDNQLNLLDAQLILKIALKIITLESLES